MRAGPAAISAFLSALLAMPAPPVAAQCTLDVRQEHDLAFNLRVARAAAGESEPGRPGAPADAPAGLTAQSDPGSETGAADVEPEQAETNETSVPGLHLSRVAEAFTAHAASPLARSRPDPYRPYQTRPPGAPLLKSEEVAASLKARGFVDVSAVRQRGRSFLAEATGPRGERVRLVLDADSGEINGVQVIGFRPARP